MENHIAMGLFALYVVIVSLLRLLTTRDLPRLRAMKRLWGVSKGALLHFLNEVIVPLIFGILYLARGISVGF